MMKNIKRIISIVLVLCMLPVYAVFADSSMQVVFNNDLNRNAGGTITVTSADAETVWFWWGDDNGEKLTDHTYLGYVHLTDGSGEFVIQRYTFIPEGAKYIIATADESEEVVASYEIPENKLSEMGDKSYSFGAVSDSHIGHSTYPNSEDDFGRIYNKMGEYGVSLIGNDGDVSSYNLINDWTLYNTKVNAFNEKFPDVACFAASGNHDASHNDFMAEEWTKYTLTDITNYKGNAQPEFYDGNKLDFLYRIENDVFIFLNATDWKDTSHTIDYYSHEQLNWLESRLEENKDKRIFFFMHYGPFKAHAITKTDGTLAGGTFENGDYMDKFFTQLYSKYPNVMAFFGHSHRGFNYQLAQYVKETGFSYTMNHNINNIENGATLVHIPSGTEPSYYYYDESTETAKSSSDANHLSEAYIADVYDDCVVLHGFDFMEDKIISYANYIVYMDAKPNDVEVKNDYLLNTADKDVTIKGTAGEENANADVVMMLTEKGADTASLAKEQILYYDQKKTDENGVYAFSFKLSESVTANEFDVYVNINGKNMSDTVTEKAVGSAWLDASIDMIEISPNKTKAVYTFKNYSSESIDAFIILAGYDENGHLINAQTATKLMPPGTEGERFSLELGDDIASVGAFAISADGVILPICKSGKIN